ncbi:hypothetical protein L1987_16997 [Smallanthus sonchifolius]|uniref:Uncharacterized protein n=1 Tax=Smallanthus sonchifolius TaxID=185202 RepID=A0ACB9IXP3_9ASTR|nr:hypothetical protein L1987_16997 [Smallanthus sonchifolius]
MESTSLREINRKRRKAAKISVEEHIAIKKQKKEASEASRIRIRPILDEFLKSNDEVYTVYTFDASLSNCERGVVHNMWREMGMKSVQGNSLMNLIVPQYLLDYMWSKAEACKIVCTQPRRISAISVAERISIERGESIGESVGYKIRLERKGGRHSSIVFCTNGVLVRVLINSGKGTPGKEKSAKMVKNAFSDITHIIVDEIHERDRFSDFMLTIIRDILPLYPHLRVVLMSATLDAERFSQYFGGCPIIRVPGFTYDVKKILSGGCTFACEVKFYQ